MTDERRKPARRPKAATESARLASPESLKILESARDLAEHSGFGKLREKVDTLVRDQAVGVVAPSFRDVMGKSYADLVTKTMRDREIAREAAVVMQGLPKADSAEVAELRALIALTEKLVDAQTRAAERMVTLAESGAATNEQLGRLESTISEGDASSNRMAQVAIGIATVLGVIQILKP